MANFLMHLELKPLLIPGKINGCLGCLVKRLETLIKRRILSKIRVCKKRIISLRFRSPFASNRVQLGGETCA